MNYRYHNPDNVPLERVDPKNEGWRLCLKSEIDKPPLDAQCWISRRWKKRKSHPRTPLDFILTYRTKAPLPQQSNFDKDYADQNTQMLGEIAMAIADDVPREICLTVDGVRWLRDRYRAGQKALRELEKIRTEKLAARDLHEEATAVSAARVCLSNDKLTHEAGSKDL